MIQLPKAPSIFFNYDEWGKIKEKIEDEKYPSMYGYIKDLVLIDLVKEDKIDLLEYICYKMGLKQEDLIKQAWREYCINHDLVRGIKNVVTGMG